MSTVDQQIKQPGRPGHRKSKAADAANLAIANVTRRHGPDDPRLPGLRRDLRAIKLEQHAREVVAQSPPLTDDQVATITALLRGAS